MLPDKTLRQMAGLAVVSLVCATPAASRATARDAEKKPSLALRARPTISFAPSRVTVTASVRGGPDDYRDFYCPTLEWEWGDGTRSEASSDCDPYEAGKSEIRRRYSTQHTFRQPGTYRVRFRLKQGNDVTGLATTTVSVRPGFGPGAGLPEHR